jgi:small subunit ribosomal protein S21
MHRAPNLLAEGGIDVSRVIVEQGESFESVLRRFKKVVQEDRILSEIRQRRFFEKPSQIRKRKKAAKKRKSRRTTLKDIMRKY